MISAIILAAGQSRRMGEPKMLLPWGNVTVIEHVISVFAEAGVEDILVITGSVREQVDEVVSRCAGRYPVRGVYNENYASGEMLSSIQCGLRALQPPPRPSLRLGLPQIRQGRTENSTDLVVGFGGGAPLRAEGEAALIGLGDQPQVQVGSVKLVMESYIRTKSPLVVPSYQMRRGHPWLVARSLWDEILLLKEDQSPREFLNKHADKVRYANVDTPDILADLDTPEDYKKYFSTG